MSLRSGARRPSGGPPGGAPQRGPPPPGDVRCAGMCPRKLCRPATRPTSHASPWWSEVRELRARPVCGRSLRPGASQGQSTGRREAGGPRRPPSPARLPQTTPPSSVTVCTQPSRDP
eukprot:1745467-Prymnesium_polylepis.1